MPSPITFLEVRPFDKCEYGLTGGPTSQTAIVATGGGGEQRNAEWSDFPRLEYNLTSPIENPTLLRVALSAIRVLKGQAIGFRFFDWFDHDAINESIDVSMGGPTYQLRVAYPVTDIYGATATVYRPITKPRPDTVTLTLNGTPVVLTDITALVISGDLFGDPLFGDSPETTTGVTIDYNSGVIHWYDLPAPTVGDVLLWSGQFDVPVRINTDVPRFTATTFEGYSLSSLALIEIRDE